MTKKLIISLAALALFGTLILSTARAQDTNAPAAPALPAASLENRISALEAYIGNGDPSGALPKDTNGNLTITAPATVGVPGPGANAWQSEQPAGACSAWKSARPLASTARLAGSRAAMPAETFGARQEILARNPYLVHDDLAGARRAQAELALHLGRGEPLHSALQEKAANDARVVLGPDHADVGDG